MKQVAVIFYVLLMLSACDNSNLSQTDKELLPESAGKYGEVLVVIDTLYEYRKTGKVVEEIFFKAIEGMPQQEAQFRMSTVAPRAFKSILKRSRNILKLNIGKGKKTAIRIEENVWAKDQLLIHITAASDDAATKVLQKNIQTIRDYFNEKEIERLKNQYKGKHLKKLINELKEEYKLQLSIPPGFVKMASDSTGYWIKKEKTIGEHEVFQGISVYFYPYYSDSVFTAKEMIARRNDFTRKFIQGSRENAYMSVYEEYQPSAKEVNLNGTYANEFRGLWNMKNDFMGGPFLHYTFVDEKRNRVVNLDGFVYAPKFNKREYLRELEAIMKTVNFN